MTDREAEITVQIGRLVERVLAHWCRVVWYFDDDYLHVEIETPEHVKFSHLLIMKAYFNQPIVAVEDICYTFVQEYIKKRLEVCQSR